LKRLFFIPVFMLAAFAGAAAFSANFQKGWDAYDKGDFETAFNEWRPLAEGGEPSAQFNLGLMYEEGQGVPQSYGIAAKWYKLAAEQGDDGAQLGLGFMYYIGRGVLQDYTRAHMWLNISALQGNVDAAEKREAVARKMSPTQLETAERLAQNFTAKRTKRTINKSPSTQASKFPDPSMRTQSSSGSGFFISKLGHIVTNEHIVRDCMSLTVGENAKNRVSVTVVKTDKRNDIALLKISSENFPSGDTKSLLRKLGIVVVPLASEGLLRSDDVELGESVLVAGYPYGEIFSDSIKVTSGLVSAERGIGDDTGQFQIDAAVQPGNSGGPIYDENGNIVGVVVAQLNKLNVAKAIGSMPENVNFGIKASTVRQFLTSSGLPTKRSNRSKSMSTKNLAKIAKNQTVMVVCDR
jgi:uncharacterized protein